MKRTCYLKAILLVAIMNLFSCNSHEKVIYSNVLDDNTEWVIEQKPKGKVTFANGKMEIEDAKGCTVWFKNKLEGNIKITYDVTIIDAGGPYDRVSDLNCFWMANDPNNPEDFFKESQNRTGKFSDYHHLKLYYVGYGGHDNTKTRFRRYNGNDERPLLPEHDLSDKKFMITANKKIQVEILVNHNDISYSRDGEVIFRMHDPKAYTNGYFGFRTVNNHMEIENFKVTQLE